MAWFTFALGVGAGLSAPACGGISDSDGGDERGSSSEVDSGPFDAGEPYDSGPVPVYRGVPKG